ncbi:MAG: hypothetical protein ABMA00_01485 [Gemmatimonas sp.]
MMLSSCHRAPLPPPATPPSTPARSASPSVPIDRDPLGPLPAALYGARLPDRLSDSTFWRMVVDLSEPGGSFQSENFVSNEMGLQHVIAHLETVAPPGGVYVGVGPEQNFTYLGALRPRIAFIVDIRRQNLLQHLWYKAIFELSPSRAAFVSRLFSRPSIATVSSALGIDSLITLLDQAPADMAMFRRTFEEAQERLVVQHGFTLDSSDLATLRYVDSIFVVSGPSLNYSSGSSGRSRGGFSNMPTFAQVASATDARGANRGFLGTEDAYRVVRDLQRRNLIVPVVGDFSGPKALRAVGNWLREREARVNVFYTSNVEQYLFQYGSWPAFYANVGTMPMDTSSAFIRSVTNRGGFGGRFGGGGGGGGGFLMQQLTSSILDIVRGVKAGTVQSYYDVQTLSKQ